MNKKKCPHCGSAQTKRNGLRTGVQLYKCKACGRQFSAGAHITQDDLYALKKYKKQGNLDFQGQSIKQIFDYFRANYPQMRAYNYNTFAAAF